MFEVRQTSFAVGGTTILHPTDLTLEKGVVHGLIGHNGSGKSTLVKLLAGQQSASGGEIRFDGHLLSDWGTRAFARQVAYLPQQLPGAQELTARELVELGRFPWHGLLRRLSRSDHEQVERAIELTGTGHLADRLVDTLSGGERQRVWLAMLLAQGARFLLLDEPLTALDMAHQLEVLALIRELGHGLGLGVAIVLHDINLAAQFCDRLVALHSGKLLAEGPASSLMDGATLEAIYGIQMQVIRHPGSGHPVALVQSGGALSSPKSAHAGRVAAQA